MSEPRKIVLILGNGFDLDLGLKTSYKDFWESEFCPKSYPAPLIHYLNQRWTNDLEAVKWYDLENELLNYYKNIPDPSKGEDIITKKERVLLESFSAYGYTCGWYNDQLDLVISLINKGVLRYHYGKSLRRVDEYLKEDGLKSPIWRDRKAFGLIKDGLCKYLSSLSHEALGSISMARALIEVMKHSVSIGNLISIYSFNYTTTLGKYNQKLAKIVEYVHGSCDSSNIIIGTGDSLDICNNYDFLIKSFDSAYHPPALVEDLFDSDEVIFFGHSIGRNDRMYFKAFFKQQVDYTRPRRKDISIFTRDEDSEIQIKRALMEMTDGGLSALFGLNNMHLFHTTKLEEEAEMMRSLILRQNIDEDNVAGLLSYLRD